MGWNPLVYLVHKDQRCFPLQRLKKAKGGIAKFPSVPTVWHLPSWCFRRVLHLMLWLWGTFLTVLSWWLSAGHGKGKKRKKGKILSPKHLTELDVLVLPASQDMEQDELSPMCHFAAGQETDIKNSRVQGGVRKRGDPTRSWGKNHGSGGSTHLSRELRKGSGWRRQRKAWTAELGHAKTFAKLAPIY